MIIHQPKFSHQNGEIILSAAVVIESSKKSAEMLPKTLWFSYPESYESYIVDQSDGFLASLLLLGMYFGEDIDIKGSVSPRLAYGVQEYQAVFNQWFPKKLCRVAINYQNLQALANTVQPGSVATAFSGGVDSFFSLWTHLPENQPIHEYQISHGLFINGFDISLNRPAQFEKLFTRYSKLFANFGLELLQVKTNLRGFYQYRLNWIYAHGGALIGTALTLGNLLSRFYVPSTYGYLNLHPLGTSPLTDNLLSNGSTQIIHHGAATVRTEKMDQLSKWVKFHSNLRVCTDLDSADNHFNCGRCDKCLNTIVYLEIIGQLPKFSVFPKKYSITDFFRWVSKVDMSNKYIMKFIYGAVSHRKYDIVIMMFFIFLSARVRSLLEAVKEAMPYRFKHWIRQLNVGDH